MESSAVARYVPQNSKKRVFPGTSSSHMEPEVIEISSPPRNRSSKSKAKAPKQDEFAYYEVIDVDMDEDRNDVMFVDRNMESNNKGKGPMAMAIPLGPSSAVQLDLMDGIQSSKKVEPSKKRKEVAFMSSAPSSASKLNPTDWARSSKKSFTPGTNNFFDLDGAGSDACTNVPFSDDDYSYLQSQFDNMDLPSGIEAPINWLPDSFNMPSTKHSFFWPQKQTEPASYTYDQLGGTSSSFLGYPPGEDASISKWLNDSYLGFVSTPEPVLVDKDAGKSVKSSVVGSSSSMAGLENEDMLKEYENFKKFDTVVDFSDHYYSRQSPRTKQPPKNWAKKIQEEWRILEKDLPDTIFVRVYESRMDLLRAVIIGAEGTPYHDGLFFFDVCFPSNYPNVPPLVHYHSGGLRINPNLYECGKVCLSLLNTWAGGQKERWVPGGSTMLQVLVSIQGLILNTKPYFNEPGYAHSSGSVHGEQSSLLYNENTLILSLKTMVYAMQNPPKNFEDLVIGHFRTRVRDILMACKAYTEGVQVGCLVRGGVQDVDEGDKSCSPKFKNDVAMYVKTLVGWFKKIGAKEAEEFIYLSEKISPLPPASAPAPVNPHGYGFPFVSALMAASYSHNYWSK